MTKAISGVTGGPHKEISDETKAQIPINPSQLQICDEVDNEEYNYLTNTGK